MKKILLLLMLVAFTSTPIAFADRDPITNGDFETGNIIPWTSNGPYAYSEGHTGSYSLFIDSVDSAQQNLIYPGIPSTDLSFWGKTVVTDEESYIVIWLYYNDGSITVNTKGPLTNTWTEFIVTTDKSLNLEKVAIRTYDENYNGEPDPEGGGSEPYREDKLIDDITLSVYSPTIVSCINDGTAKNVFDYMTPIYVKGEYYPPMPDVAFRSFDVFVVDDTTWSNGMAIPPSLVSYYNYGQAVIIPDTYGDLAPTGVVAGSYWDSGIVLQWLNPGYYDIIIDINHNGVYDEGIDALDDNDVNGGGIEVTIQAFMVPEAPLGTLSLLSVMLLGYSILSKKQNIPI